MAETAWVLYASRIPDGTLKRTFAGFAAGLLSTVLAAQALALTQPGSTTPIPTDDEVKNALASQGDNLEPKTDAAITPETFRPECSLTFTVLVRMSDYKNSFGWYNVTGRKPDFSELYEFIRCSDPPANWDQSYTNLTTRSLDIKSDTRYLGGEIGFFQAVKNGGCADVSQPSTVDLVVYSQRALNPDSTQDNPFIHLLIMDSKVKSNVFYFAWEDQLRGDDDFSDLVLRVEGITCSGGGEDCDTNLPGVCAQGTTRCSNGKIVCGARQPASDELCNGLDDDCDGQVDDGDLCEPNELCDRGRCIHGCSGSEFPCSPGQVCRADGYCVDSSCRETDCPPGQVCVGGNCIDPCNGVVCPYAQQCRAGRCVDPCAGVGCGDGQVCVDGACLTDCSCSGCAAPLDCDETRGRCVEGSCATMTCVSGTHCVAGTCKDDCEGAVCPLGQTCRAGQCEGDIIGPDPGSDAGTSPDGGISIPPDSGTGATGGGAAGNVGATGKYKAPPDSPACGCRTPPNAPSRGWAWLALSGIALAWAARRRPARVLLRDQHPC